MPVDEGGAGTPAARRGSARAWPVIAIALLFLLGHALVLALPRGAAQPLGFGFLVTAPLLAAAACLWRGRRSEAAIGWWALAAGMVLWSAGMATNMYQELARGQLFTPNASLLLYVLYGVPLIFAMANAGDRRWYLVAIDATLAVLIGYMYFKYTASFAFVDDDGDAGFGDLRLMLDIENVFIAAFALLRWLASEEGARRACLRAFAVFGWVYLCAAAIINHLLSSVPFGTPADLVIDLPFLLLAAMAMLAGERRDVPIPRRLALAVRAGSPLILAMALFVVSALMMRDHPGLAIAGFGLALLGSGLRGVLMQVLAHERQDALDRLSRTDGLTGVANRRHLDQVLQHEWDRARRVGHGLALLLVDVDHFKQFNDRFGHPVGDQCLRAVASALSGCATRSSDLVARFGGEEFAVVVPATSEHAVAELAECMRAAVERITLPAAGPVTISIGMGVIDAVGHGSVQGLVEAADAALYEAKHRGRNRVERRRLPGHGLAAAIVAATAR